MGYIYFLLPAVSRPARGGWIEIVGTCSKPPGGRSRPARGGWIEIRLA